MIPQTLSSLFFLLLSGLFTSSQAARDNDYYFPSFVNPNAKNKMYWKDSVNVLEDLDQFESLYITYHHCVWSKYGTRYGTGEDYDENDDNNGNFDNGCAGFGGGEYYWYMGRTQCFRANVAYSLYGVLKGDSTKKKRGSYCHAGTYINSFFTTFGVESFAGPMGLGTNTANSVCLSSQNGGGGEGGGGGSQDNSFNYAKVDDDYLSDDYQYYDVATYSSQGTGCSADGQFVIDQYSGPFCHGRNYDSTLDQLENFNAALQEMDCTEVYSASGNYNNDDKDRRRRELNEKDKEEDHRALSEDGYDFDYDFEDMAAYNILAFSKSCSVSQYPRDCPDPYGIKRNYAKKIQRALAYKTGRLRDLGTNFVRGLSWLFFAVGVLLCGGSYYLSQAEDQSTRKEEKQKRRETRRSTRAGRKQRKNNDDDGDASTVVEEGIESNLSNVSDNASLSSKSSRKSKSCMPKLKLPKKFRKGNGSCSARDVEEAMLEGCMDTGSSIGSCAGVEVEAENESVLCMDSVHTGDAPWDTYSEAGTSMAESLVYLTEKEERIKANLAGNPAPSSDTPYLPRGYLAMGANSILRGNSSNSNNSKSSQQKRDVEAGSKEEEPERINKILGTAAAVGAVAAVGTAAAYAASPNYTAEVQVEEERSLADPEGGYIPMKDDLQNRSMEPQEEGQEQEYKGGQDGYITMGDLLERAASFVSQSTGIGAGNSWAEDDSYFNDAKNRERSALSVHRVPTGEWGKPPVKEDDESSVGGVSSPGKGGIVTAGAAAAGTVAIAAAATSTKSKSKSKWPKRLRAVFPGSPGRKAKKNKEKQASPVPQKGQRDLPPAVVEQAKSSEAPPTMEQLPVEETTKELPPPLPLPVEEASVEARSGTPLPVPIEETTNELRPPSPLPNPDEETTKEIKPPFPVRIMTRPSQEDPMPVPISPSPSHKDPPLDHIDDDMNHDELSASQGDPTFRDRDLLVDTGSAMLTPEVAAREDAQISPASSFAESIGNTGAAMGAAIVGASAVGLAAIGAAVFGSSDEKERDSTQPVEQVLEDYQLMGQYEMNRDQVDGAAKVAEDEDKYLEATDPEVPEVVEADQSKSKKKKKVGAFFRRSPKSPENTKSVKSPENRKSVVGLFTKSPKALSPSKMATAPPQRLPPMLPPMLTNPPSDSKTSKKKVRSSSKSRLPQRRFSFTKSRKQKSKQQEKVPLVPPGLALSSDKGDEETNAREVNNEEPEQEEQAAKTFDLTAMIDIIEPSMAPESQKELYSATPPVSQKEFAASSSAGKGGEQSEVPQVTSLYSM